MATIPNAMLLCASSPYATDGAMWTAYRRHHGKDDSPVLFWKAPTRVMNPKVPQRVIDEAYQDDADAADAEYGANFRTGLASFISRDVVNAAVIEGRYELSPIPGTQYEARIDPSGGGRDSMTLAIAHGEGDRIILDLLRERKPPFSPDAVCKEFADTIKAYGLTSARADNYALQWPRERMAVHGVDVGTEPLPKSKIYLSLLPLLNSRRVEMLDDAVMVKQLCNLQRHTAHGGHDTVDHPRGQHDDVINAAALAIVAVSRRAAQQVPMVAPIIIGKNQPPTPGLSTTEAFYEWSNGVGGGTWWGPV
jgi:hypothetical protein